MPPIEPPFSACFVLADSAAKKVPSSRSADDLVGERPRCGERIDWIYVTERNERNERFLGSGPRTRGRTLRTSPRAFQERRWNDVVPFYAEQETPMEGFATPRLVRYMEAMRYRNEDMSLFQKYWKEELEKRYQRHVPETPILLYGRTSHSQLVFHVRANESATHYQPIKRNISTQSK
jgi:hypothetical protein